VRRLFITGTDTGVGKTTVACALAAAFVRRGMRVATLKPVETGCPDGPDGLEPADALRLARAAGEALPPARTLAAICPNRFALPVSPEAAARAAGSAVDLAAIDHALAARAGADLLLVEGAGGLLVPLGEGLVTADLIARLSLPVLVVARAALGTVNHSLLTVEAIRRRGLVLAGVILSQASPERGPDEASNAAAIARHGGVAVLGTLPFIAGAADDALAKAAARTLDLDALLAAL